MKPFLAALIVLCLAFTACDACNAQCPGGVCPAQPRQPAFQPIVQRAVQPGYRAAQRQAQWTYPGEIHAHLANGHGFNASGMSQAQAEAEHDRLHNVARRSASVSLASQPRALNGDPPRTRLVGRLFRRGR